MSLAGLFPEVPSLQFQAVDTTASASNATSVLTGSPSTSRGASRPQTASSRPLTGKSGGVMNLSSEVKQAMYQAFLVSAADCLHVCHAHLTDPANFWKCINDAYVEQHSNTAESYGALLHCHACFRYATSGAKQGLVSELGYRLGKCELPRSLCVNPSTLNA